MSTLRADLQIAPQEIYTSSSTQGTDLGAIATTGDGRYFRYAKAGATALVPGSLYQGPANSNANWSPVGGLTVGQANPTGDNQFTLNSSITLAANDLAGAIMSVVASTGAGYSYKVASNTAVSAATGTVITLEDPLATNLATSSKVTFYPNPYNGIVITGTTITGPIVGVAVYAVTAGQYGWIQTRGLASVLMGGTAAPGQGVGPAATTGSVAPATASSGFVGYSPATSNITEFDLIKLEID